MLEYGEVLTTVIVYVPYSVGTNSAISTLFVVLDEATNFPVGEYILKPNFVCKHKKTFPLLKQKGQKTKKDRNLT